MVFWITQEIPIFTYQLNEFSCSQLSAVSREEWFVSKSTPKWAGYKPKGMNLVVEIAGTMVGAGGYACHFPKPTTQAAANSILPLVQLTLASRLLKFELQPLHQVWLKATYVKEACLCFTSLIPRNILSYNLSRVQGNHSLSALWVIKIFKVTKMSTTEKIISTNHM